MENNTNKNTTKKVVCQEINVLSLFGAINNAYEKRENATIKLSDFAEKTYYDDGTVEEKTEDKNNKK